MTPLQRRCADISYKLKLTHLSSVLDSVEPIAAIYREKQEAEPFVLGNSHASLALFTVLESIGKCDAVEMTIRHGTHARRDVAHGVWVSGGSLGQAETVAVGLAISNPKRKVWLLTSDGACMEGAVYEAFRIAGKYASNLMVTIVANGRGAYGNITDVDLSGLRSQVGCRIVRGCNDYPPWLTGHAGHYLTLTEAQHRELVNL